MPKKHLKGKHSTGNECVSASVPVLHSLGEMSLKVYIHHLCNVSLL